MAKSSIERVIEKQNREMKRQAKNDTNREIASQIVGRAKTINGITIMDKESEILLQAILDQYDGNDDNCVEFDEEPLPSYIEESISVGFKKLLMYGVISRADEYIGGATVFINESGKVYFDNKMLANKKESKEKLASNTQRKEYDVFLSHASADKEEYVDDLKNEIKKLGISIFYDTDELDWGDNWKEKILNGVEASEFAIIVITENYFDREWTNRELAGFLKRQNDNHQKIVLPLLHNITLENLKEKYPELADIQCISTIDKTKSDLVVLLAKELIKRYK